MNAEYEGKEEGDATDSVGNEENEVNIEVDGGIYDERIILVSYLILHFNNIHQLVKTICLPCQNKLE